MGAVSSRLWSPETPSQPRGQSPLPTTGTQPPDEQTRFITSRTPQTRLFESNQTYFGPRFVIADQVPSGTGSSSSPTGISRAFWEEILAVLRAGMPQGEDLEGLGNVYSQLPPADMKLVTTLQCKVSLHKPSLRFHKQPANNTSTFQHNPLHTFEFEYDSVTPCIVKVYCGVKEQRVKDPEGNMILNYVDKAGYPVQPWVFGPLQGGMKQGFTLPEENAFELWTGSHVNLSASGFPDPSSSQPPISSPLSPGTPFSAQSTAPLIPPSPIGPNFSENRDIIVNVKENQDPNKENFDLDTVYPLVIVLEADGGNDGVGYPEVNRQITYVLSTAMPDQTYSPKIAKQIVRIGTQIYLIQDIFGFTEPGEGSMTDVSDPTSTTKECIICMAEAKDTIVLPCRHLCLCHECAEVLRMQGRDTNGPAASRQGPPKCPICRQVFHSLLHIKLPPPFEARDSIASRRRSVVDHNPVAITAN